MAKKKNGLTKMAAMLVAAFTGLIAQQVSATENGNEHYPLGVLTVQPAILPPPGDTEFYNYDAYVEGSRFADNHGNSSPQLPGFNLQVYVEAPRLIHTWNSTIGPFNISSGITFNIFSTHLGVGGENFNRFAVGDVSIQPLWLTYNTSTFHFLIGPNIWAPTGAYDKNNPASPGLNYWTFAPEVAVTWLPQPAWELSADMFTQFNTTNNATHYRSGNDSNIDFLVGWRPLAVAPKVQLGVSGYIYRQWSDDRANGQTVLDNRGRVLGIGPQIRWDVIPHGGLVFKLQHEFDVRNRPEGNRIWIEFAAPVG